jgi:hypothetical protein
MSQSGSYTVEFGNFPDSFLDDFYYLVDANLKSRFTNQPKNVIFVKADEERKTLSTVESLILELSLAGMTKSDRLVVVGGGYLQDIGTLVASLYMRGIKWDYYPTTLAAMGDSCIGGKSCRAEERWEVCFLSILPDYLSSFVLQHIQKQSLICPVIP